MIIGQTFGMIRIQLTQTSISLTKPEYLHRLRLKSTSGEHLEGRMALPDT